MRGMSYPRPRHRHGRAHVRHQFQRAKARGLRQCIRWHGRFDWYDEDDEEGSAGWRWTPRRRARAIGRAATDRKACSCYMCGHVRDREGLTLQEHRLVMHETDEQRDLETGADEYPLGKYANIDDEPDGWRDHPSFIDPRRGVPECGMGEAA